MKGKIATEKEALTLCKILKVLTFIGRIGVIIGIISLLIVMIVLPVVFYNTKIDRNSITCFNNKISYEIKDETVVFRANEYEFETDEEDVVTLVKWADDKINEENVFETIQKDYKRIFGIIEYKIIEGVIVLVATFLILRYLALVLRDTINKKTPFSKINAIRMYRISFINLVLFAIMLIADILCQIIANVEIGTLYLNTLVDAGIFYVLSWAINKGIAKTPKTKKIEE